MQGNSRELTDIMMNKLSNEITGKTELRNLGIQGLCLEAKTVERHITNNPDITSAAHHVLFEWLDRHEDRKVAYKMLCDALKTVNMQFKIQSLKED